MKRTVTVMIALLLILGMFPLGVSAEHSVDEVQKKVDALPEFTTVETVESQAYVQAFEQAKEAVYALALLTEGEMEQVSHYQKAFQLYIELIVMKAQSLLPQEPITMENYSQQTAALDKVNDLLFEEEPLYMLAEYTNDTFNEHFFPPETTTGFVSLYDVQVAYHAACDVRTAFLVTLNDAERYELQQRDYAQELAKYPQEFTGENVLTYAKEFVMLIYEVEEYDGKYYWLNEFSKENRNRYDVLRDSFELSMGIYANYFMEELDEKILEVCNLQNAVSYSNLQLQLVERPRYDELAGQIEALIYINGQRVYSDMKQIAAFQAYEQLFWPSTYIYGDANGDCLVNALDALVILKVAVGKEKLSKARFDTNDLNVDGSVDAKDALYVLQYAVEKINWFPVEAQLYGILM